MTNSKPTSASSSSSAPAVMSLAVLVLLMSSFDASHAFQQKHGRPTYHHQLLQHQRMQDHTRMRSSIPVDFRDSSRRNGRRRPRSQGTQSQPSSSSSSSSSSPLLSSTTRSTRRSAAAGAAIPLPRPYDDNQESSSINIGKAQQQKRPNRFVTTISPPPSPKTMIRQWKQMQRKRQLARYLKSSTLVSPPTTTTTVADETETDSTAAAVTADTTAASTTTNGLSKMDIALFMTYFCNIAVVTLSVVTVPALASEHFATIAGAATSSTAASASTSAAFVASVASMAPLGGAFGKVVNGFVCQRFGGRTASWTYLLALAGVSGAMSLSRGLGSIGVLLMGLEFLSSIQWTSVCHILDRHYRAKPQLMARGIALLSLSSTLGALAAKTIGAGLLQATNWRTVCRLGSVAAVIGAAAMYLGVDRSDKNVMSNVPTSSSTESNEQSVGPSNSASPLSILKSILGNRVFWMVGMAHSLGYLARGNDRLLGAFLTEATSLPSHIAAGLTSSVTIGFVGGLVQGRIFSSMDSVKRKMKMINRNYVASLASVLGLAACGIGGMTNLLGGNTNLLAAAITVFAGIMASTVSFQFYQFPNLVSSNVFSENSAVSLSLLDAAGFFFTAQVLAANSRILGNFGWSASWSFMALVFGVGGTIMSRAIQPVLIQAKRSQRSFEASTTD